MLHRASRIPVRILVVGADSERTERTSAIEPARNRELDESVTLGCHDGVTAWLGVGGRRGERCESGDEGDGRDARVGGSVRRE